MVECRKAIEVEDFENKFQSLRELKREKEKEEWESCFNFPIFLHRIFFVYNENMNINLKGRILN